jgi:succinyl-CoA synthetase beta subunit
MEIRDKIREFISSIGERQTIFEYEVKGFLRDLGISVPKGVYVPAGEPLPAEIDRLSAPLAVKTVSTGGGSKSEVGGVRLGVSKGDQLKNAVAELSRLENAEGVLIEEMMPPGFEVIVGGTVDAEFGSIVMFGMGGFFVELFQDVSFALAPVTEAQAQWLINETKGAKVLRGFRGKPPLDVAALSDIIIIVSELMASGLFHEIDLNPVVIYPFAAIVLDAKMKRT